MSLSNFEISFCKPGDLNRLIKLLDEEFVFSKNRKISLKRRFGGLLVKENLGNILAGKLGNELVSSVALKPFKYFLEGSVLKGVMVGLVFTKKEYRQQGFGGALLKKASRVLAARQQDFAVLWTHIPQFYEREGWFRLDSGFFGALKKGKPKLKKLAYKASVCLKRDLKEVNILRKQLSAYVVRDLSSYSCLPLPVTETKVVKFFLKNKLDGHIILGREQASNDVYVYEVFSKSKTYNIYLDFLLSGKFNNIFINSYKQDQFKRFLDEQKIVSWSKQGLTMFKIVHKKLKKNIFKKIYIPFFDRI